MYADPNKFLAIVLITAVLSYMTCLSLVGLYNYLGGLDRSIKKLQSSHISATPRLGGVAILISIILVEFIFGGLFRLWFLVAVVPVFLIGLLEDFHFETNPKLRLLVGGIASLIAIFLSDTRITHVDFFILDAVLIFAPLAVTFTIFASVGMINAINLIDGIHGFASAITVITSLAIYMIAHQVGEYGIASMAALVAAASLGLFFFSYPTGRIFMGDAGAYTLGFLIAWQIILLLDRHPDLSAWSLLAITFWPVMDTLFSIFRRLSKGKRTNRPDLLHFHQLVMRFWEVISKNRISRKVANPLATATILPLALIPVILGIRFSHDVFTGQLIIIIGAILYVALYNATFFVLRNRNLRKKVSNFIEPLWSRFCS